MKRFIIITLMLLAVVSYGQQLSEEETWELVNRTETIPDATPVVKSHTYALFNLDEKSEEEKAKDRQIYYEIYLRYIQSLDLSPKQYNLYANDVRLYSTWREGQVSHGVVISY